MILVTGGTGTIGKDIVKQLGRLGVQTRVLTRDPAKAADLKASSVEIVKGDLADAASIDAALVGIEKLFLLTTSVPESTAQLSNAITAAKKAGVKHIVRLSAAGADAGSPIALSRWHAVTETELKASGVAWTILQPTWFMQNLLGSLATIKQGAFYGSTKDGKVSQIDARDIADVSVKVLTSDGHAGQTYVLTGPGALSQDDAASKLSKAIGKDVKYVDIPGTNFKDALVGAGLTEWLADDYVTMHTYFSTGAAAAISPAVEQILGHKGRSFDTFVTDFAPAFA